MRWKNAVSVRMAPHTPHRMKNLIMSIGSSSPSKPKMTIIRMPNISIAGVVTMRLMLRLGV
jgi:hypothetical protein